MKPSEIFEGENSSLRKTFDEATHNEELERVSEKLFNSFRDRRLFDIGQFDEEIEAEIRGEVTNALTTYTSSRIQEEREKIYAELEKMQSVYETMDTMSALKRLKALNQQKT